MPNIHTFQLALLALIPVKELFDTGKVGHEVREERVAEGDGRDVVELVEAFVL